MPAPAITCLLVAAVLLATVSVAAGVLLAVLCAVAQFALPLFSGEV